MIQKPDFQAGLDRMRPKIEANKEIPQTLKIPKDAEINPELAFKKLFLYALASGIEKLGDSKGALSYIDNILNSTEESLWIDLGEAIQQQHRIKIFKHYDISMDIHEPINMMGLPSTILEELFNKAIDPRKLKQIINKEIEIRHG